MIREPKTGFTYIHVIPPEWGPFVDIRACWQHAARKYPWILVIPPSDFRWQADNNSESWRDENAVFIYWAPNWDPDREPLITHLHDRKTKDRKGAKVVGVFFEAMAKDLGRLLPRHRVCLEQFENVAKSLDGVLVHTPGAVEFMDCLGALDIKADLLPVGWDPEVMGRPRWSTENHHDYVFYGSRVGKRALAIPYLLDNLGARLVDRSGAFGRGLLSALDNSRANLYIAHSDVDSFSTWRTWQCIASSAALVAEPADMWPLTAEHFVEIPRLTLENAEAVSENLRTILHQDLEAVAYRAHQDLGHEFTIDRIIERYLIPFGERLRAR